MEELLLHKLGEFLYDYESCNDYFQKQKIREKIKAIHTLLDLPYIEPKNTLKQIIKRLWDF